MAKNILNELTSELATLETELKDFKTAVGYLKGAKENVQNAVEAVNIAENYHVASLSTIENAYARLNMVIESVESLSKKIDKVDFPLRLNSIEENLQQVIKSIDETTKSTLKQVKEASDSIIKADFDNKFKTLDGVVNTSISATKTIVADTHKATAAQTDRTIRQINDLRDIIKKSGQEQVSFFTSLDLPTQFYHLDKTIRTVDASVLDIKRRLDGLELSLAGKIIEMQQEISLSLNKSFNDLRTDLIKEAKSSEKRFYLLCGLMIFMSIVIFLLVRFKK